MPNESVLERAMTAARLRAIFDLYEQRPPAGIRLTHAGRVRLSELKHNLRAGREREPFGVLWDVRHWKLDAHIAILEAREDAPLAFAYLDMNGLGQINNVHGHEAGDLALKAYFQAVSSALGDRGQAYRLSGGADEVLVLLPNHDEEAAARSITIACKELMNVHLWPMHPSSLLSIAAGIVTTTSPSALPTELRADADQEQKRAKLQSRKADPRPSVIAIRGREDLTVLEHAPAGYPVAISASYFRDSDRRIGIGFAITNTGRDPLPPFKLAVFHPKLGSNFMFPSSKTGELLPHQKRDFLCPVFMNGAIFGGHFPKFTHAGNGEPLTTEDDAQFEFRLVLEDSDNKVLFASKRIGRRLVMMLRRSLENGTDIKATADEWNELGYGRAGE